MMTPPHASQTRPRLIGTDMTPMIDVVFLLLVFFLYAVMHMVEARGVTLTLPQVDTAEAVTRDPLTIDITSDGKILFLATPVEADALVPAVNRILTREPSRGILLRADRESRTGLTVLVISRLKHAGYASVTLAVSEAP